MHVIKISMWLKWVKFKCFAFTGEWKHKQSLSGTFTNFFIKKETKVKTETSTTASTQSDNTSDNIMIPPPPKASVAGPSVSIIDKYV